MVTQEAGEACKHVSQITCSIIYHSNKASKQFWQCIILSVLCSEVHYFLYILLHVPIPGLSLQQCLLPS